MRQCVSEGLNVDFRSHDALLPRAAIRGKGTYKDNTEQATLAETKK